MSTSEILSAEGLTPPRPLWHFLAPRHWPVWLGLALARALILLPRPAQLACGRGLGRMAARLLGSRRRITRKNLELAFPELAPAARERLVRAHFEDLGMALSDTAMAWWASDRRLAGLLQLEGAEHLEAARRDGRGAILLTGHYTPLELCGRLLGAEIPVVATYRDTGQALLDEIMRRGRRRAATRIVSKRAVRQALKYLRQGEAVWFAMDQAKTGSNAAVVPFFGHPTVTGTSPSRIAAATGAAVLMLWPERLPDGRIRVRILPALKDFPSVDWSADAARLNRLLEQHIREVPSQYFWVHRRFKGEQDPYGAESRGRASP